MYSIAKAIPAVFLAGIFVLLVSNRPVAAQTDVTGRTEVEVGVAVNGISFKGKNKTGRQFYDFTLELEPGCGAKITYVEKPIWVVDQNRDGELSLQEIDFFHVWGGKLSTPDTITRIAIINVDHAVTEDSEFEVVVKFDKLTTASCKFYITPTSEEGYQIASLGEGMKPGTNLFALATYAIIPGMSTAVINNTGGDISALTFSPSAGYRLLAASEVDAKTDRVLSQTKCRQVCTLKLAKPIPPNGVVAFNVSFSPLPRGRRVINLLVTPVHGNVQRKPRGH